MPPTSPEGGPVSNPTPTQGWYPDPSGSGVRWWDGGQWTGHTAPSNQFPPPDGGGFGAQGAAAWGEGHPAGGPPWGAAPGRGGGPGWVGPPGAGAPTSTWARNRYSFIAVIIVAAYVLLALAARVAFLGILPLGMSIRAMSAKEPLAPVALGIAIVGIVAGIALYVR